MKKLARWFIVLFSTLLALALVSGGVVYLRVEPLFPIPPTVSADPSLPRFTVEGIDFHGELFGDPADPVVVVIHGGPGGDYRNLRVLRSLADDGYRVVFYDQLGSGLSPRVPDDQLTLDQTVEDLDRIVRHFGEGRPVHLVGHSWGAMVAAYYLARHGSGKGDGGIK